MLFVWSFGQSAWLLTRCLHAFLHLAHYATDQEGWTQKNKNLESSSVYLVEDLYSTIQLVPTVHPVTPFNENGGKKNTKIHFDNNNKKNMNKPNWANKLQTSLSSKNEGREANTEGHIAAQVADANVSTPVCSLLPKAFSSFFFFVEPKRGCWNRKETWALKLFLNIGRKSVSIRQVLW